MAAEAEAGTVTWWTPLYSSGSASGSHGWGCRQWRRERTKWDFILENVASRMEKDWGERTRRKGGVGHHNDNRERLGEPRLRHIVGKGNE